MSAISNHLLESAARSISDDAELKLAAVSLLAELARPDDASAAENISRDAVQHNASLKDEPRIDRFLVICVSLDGGMRNCMIQKMSIEI
jgi:hypothetical protein